MSERIEVPDSGITAQWYYEYTSGYTLADPHPFDTYRQGVKDGIACANEQISKVGDTKRPFLSDGEIEAHGNSFYDSPLHDRLMYREGAKWARDRYEGRNGSSDTPATPWTPEVGMKCAFWYDETGSDKTEAGIFEFFSSEGRPSTDQHNYDHCAALESLDEIGKAPQYFQNRGRWSGE